MKKLSLTMVPATLLLLQLGVQAQEPALSYPAFMIQVQEQHPLARKADNSKTYGELQLRAARGNYDPVLSGSYRQKHYNGSNYYSSLNAELKQPIFTSQYLKAGYDLGTGPYLNPEYNTPAEGLPFLGVEAALLQGLSIDKRRAETIKARGYAEYYDADRTDQLNLLLLNAASIYFDWLYQARSVKLNTYFLDLARERLAAMQSLAAIGERPMIDTVEAGILYQSRLLELQSAQIELQKTTNVLQQYLWQNGQPLGPEKLTLPGDSLESGYERFKAQLAKTIYNEVGANPVILKYQALGKVLATESRYRRELIKPVLNLQYNFLSPASAERMPSFNRNNYKWGLELQFPLLFRNPANAYKMAKLSVKNNELETDNKRNELELKRRALRQNLELLSQQLMNAAKTASFSKQMLEGEQLKFGIGESSLFLLNTRENKWLESELKLAAYRLKFIHTVLELNYLNGDLNYGQ